MLGAWSTQAAHPRHPLAPCLFPTHPGPFSDPEDAEIRVQLKLLQPPASAQQNKH